MASDKMTDALGVKEEWWDNRIESIKETWNSVDTISDVILKEAEDQRTESFGDTGIGLSEYEVKLVTVGYLIGLTKSVADKQSVSPENDFIKFLIEMAKRQGGE
jgi:hypothetical protein